MATITDAGGEGLGAGVNPQALAQLPAGVRAAYAQAFTASLGTVFLVATAVALVGFLLTWLLPERPLRETIAAATESDIGGDVGQAFAMPTESDPLVHVQRGLAVLANRDERRRSVEKIVERAGVELNPAAAWLLARLEKDPALDPSALARAPRGARTHRRSARGTQGQRSRRRNRPRGGSRARAPPDGGGMPRLQPARRSAARTSGGAMA